MAALFNRGELRLFLRSVIEDATAQIENLAEDELLARSTDDLLDEFAPVAELVVPSLSDDPVDGKVDETSVQVTDSWGIGLADTRTVRGFSISATYGFTGDARLFHYQPSHHQLTTFDAAITADRITVTSDQTGADTDEARAIEAVARKVDPIRRELGFVAADVNAHNPHVRDHLRQVIERRKSRVQQRRKLAGVLGFPITKRRDAPRPVPMARKKIGSARNPRPRPAYEDEPALTEAQYEDVIAVIRSTLIAMERTPSVASGKDEEELRDQILVQLNGTFTGGATGETFVQKGKTDILVKDAERHVFVGECKWWDGPKACGDAVGQLLSYLPWRDEKAALILFIDRKDATAVIDKAEVAVREHESFKRVGSPSDDPSARRNFVLGHPDDREREIHLAALFAVLPKDV